MKRPLVLILAVLASGCATSTIGSNDPMFAVAPGMSVEAFLQAVNANDYATMANIFGTQDGPVGDTGGAFGCAFKKMGSWVGLGDSCEDRFNIELRMSAIAQLLRHDDYNLAADTPVPGRRIPARQLAVTLTRDGRQFDDVPFTLVQADGGRWLVESIGLERITQTTP